ncbi:membrane protein insertion efficiency factor YidD [Candidatus Uhrbacteria bacterium]|nr:membrane protein insertion efficiency factor YidD [Candidatus Uhrbacteria bacterium]
MHCYQWALSPDHAFWAKAVFPHGYCKFHPTCSEYTRVSVLKYGVIRGVLRGSWRIIRCNPFSRGGVDEPR